ncbi:MAG: hypothetical protein B7733_05900 [Myxococcales bacterium FL481]|nr:MAG: hypothetical protein B7733_05900 [Myxococcales bacterium FL481]
MSVGYEIEQLEFDIATALASNIPPGVSVRWTGDGLAARVPAVDISWLDMPHGARPVEKTAAKSVPAEGHVTFTADVASEGAKIRINGRVIEIAHDPGQPFVTYYRDAVVAAINDEHFPVDITATPSGTQAGRITLTANSPGALRTVTGPHQDWVETSSQIVRDYRRQLYGLCEVRCRSITRRGVDAHTLAARCHLAPSLPAAQASMLAAGISLSPSGSPRDLSALVDGARESILVADFRVGVRLLHSELVETIDHVTVDGTAGGVTGTITID